MFTSLRFFAFSSWISWKLHFFKAFNWSNNIAFNYTEVVIIFWHMCYISVSLFSVEYGVQSSTISVCSCRHSMCHLSSGQSRSQQSSKTLPCRSVKCPFSPLPSAGTLNHPQGRGSPRKIGWGVRPAFQISCLSLRPKSAILNFSTLFDTLRPDPLDLIYWMVTIFVFDGVTLKTGHWLRWFTKSLQCLWYFSNMNFPQIPT